MPGIAVTTGCCGMARTPVRVTAKARIEVVAYIMNDYCLEVDQIE